LAPTGFTDAGGLATAAGAAAANGHPNVRPRAGCVTVRCEGAGGDGPAAFGSRLAVVVVAASGSPGAAAAVNSKTASGVVANNSQRRTLGIPCSPCRSRDFRTRRKPDKRVRIPERVWRPIKNLRMLQKGNEDATPPQNAYPARRLSVASAAREASEDQRSGGILFVFVQRQMVASFDFVSARPQTPQRRSGFSA
jgi:hypothetical protein